VYIIPVTRSDGLKTPRASAWLLIVLCIRGTVSWAETPTPRLDIAPQALPSALAAFADHTGLQVLYVSTIVEGKNSKGAHGEGPPAEILTQLLEGTGLRFSFLNERTVQILPPAPKPGRSSHAPAQSAHSVGTPGDPANTLEEVVVTANRRDEKQNDVPMSIMTWTAAMLKESGVKSLGDLATRTPGVEFDFYPDLGPGTLTNIAIRGVNSRDGSTTGVFLDDTSMPSDTGGTFGKPYPFPFDLERVEVLRGPQGTLLGEGTEGGAIRLIQQSPSLTKLSGYTQGRVETTSSGEPSYEIGAAGGGPLKENVLGFRASAWGRWQGGYIDRVDPLTNEVVNDNANRVISQSFHGALAAAVGGGFLLTPAITYQSLSSQDAQTFTPALSDPGAGVLRSGKLLAQPVSDEFTLATLTLAGPLRSAQLSAVTSYFHRHVSEVTDATNNPDDLGSPLGLGYPSSEADALPSTGYLYQSTWSQEIRLTSESPESRSSWIIGGLYQHTTSTVVGLLYPHLNGKGNPVNAKQTTYDDANNSVAAYGEVRIPIGKRFTADLGIRAEYAAFEVAMTGAPLANPDPTVTGLSGLETPLSPKLVMEYRPSDKALWYAGVTSGYRNGGVNSRIYWWCREVTPTTFQPDKVWNYEVGSKQTLLDGRMQIDASLFHMRWLQLQNDVAQGGCDTSFIVNVGGAVSNGFDLSLQAVAGAHTRFSLTVGYTDSYTDTVVTDGAVLVRRKVAVGSLPLVASPLDATGSITYELPMSRGYTLTARAEDVFHSHNPGPFDSQILGSRNYDPGKVSNPATNVLNLKFTAGRPDRDVSIGIDNALNSQPVLLLRDAFFGSTYFYASTLRPRTVSLDFNKRF
jgi:iron complex outermembrane recepter protein